MKIGTSLESLGDDLVNEEARSLGATTGEIAITDVVSALAYMQQLGQHLVEWDEGLFRQADAILQLERDAAHDSLLCL